MRNVTDTLIYWAIMCALLVFIGWLLFTPAPGHDPLIQFQHAAVLS
jgi:uncharacterized membrane protein